MTKKAKTKVEDKEVKDMPEGQPKEKDTKPPTKKSAKTAKATGKTTKKPTGGQSVEVEKLKKEIAALEEKMVDVAEKEGEWHNKYLRLSAEFDNYRKRTLTEKAELTKTANAELLKDMLSVVDDFERGMDNMDKSEDVNALKEGVHLIHAKFIEFIRQNGVAEIEAKEKAFDVDFHEALTKIPAPTEELKGKVVDVIEKGYLLNEKVIRYAKVVVGE